MTIGAGMYLIGIVSTVILIIIQIILHNDINWLHVKKTKLLCVYGVQEEDYQNSVRNMLMGHGIKLLSTYVKRDMEKAEGTMNF